jgi:hypothetical protein
MTEKKNCDHCGSDLHPTIRCPLQAEIVGYCDPSHIDRMNADQISGYMVHDEPGVNRGLALVRIDTVRRFGEMLSKAQDHALDMGNKALLLQAELQAAKHHLKAVTEDYRRHVDSGDGGITPQFCFELMAAERWLANPTPHARCDGNHADAVPCDDPECWLK